MAKVSFGDFRGKAERSHVTSLMSWNTNFGGSQSPAKTSKNLIQNHMEVGVLVDSPNKPQQHQCWTTVSRVKCLTSLGFQVILLNSYFTLSVPEMSQVTDTP
jgi:hypothetical protein